MAVVAEIAAEAARFRIDVLVLVENAGDGMALRQQHRRHQGHGDAEREARGKAQGSHSFTHLRNLQEGMVIRRKYLAEIEAPPKQKKPKEKGALHERAP